MLLKLASVARPRQPGLAHDAAAAGVVALAAVSFYVSCASLLFQGRLASHLPAAIGAALLGGALLSLVAAWRGSLPLASAGAVSTSVPILAALTAGIAGSASPASALPTAVVGLALTAAVTGLAWWWMGRQGWGSLAGFIPYPVIGGFMAASGWLLATGGLGVAAGERFSWAALPGWWAHLPDGRLAAGMAVGLVLFAVGQRWRHPLVVPLLLLAGGLSLHGGLSLAGISLERARVGGWLPAPFLHPVPVWPLQPSVLAAVQWELLLAQAGWITAFAIVSTLNLLLTTSSLEMAWDVRADLNRDMQTFGQAHLLAAAMGGLAGGPSLSRSVLNRNAGARSRASGLLLAGLCLAAMAWGGPAVAWVPLPLLGGLLLAQGLDLMKAWLLDHRRQLRRRDYFTVLAMVGVTAVLGFLPAVCLGVLMCCVDFAVTQSQFSPVRRVVRRDAWLSSVERPPAQAELLMRQGAGLQIVELQGVLFFGSAQRLLQQVEPLLTDSPPARCLLLDFRHVRSLDSSAAQALARLLKAAQRRDIEVQLSGLQGGQAAILQSAGVPALAAPVRHASVDEAVAAWDDALLAAHPAPAGGPEDVEHQLAGPLGSTLAGRLMPAFVRRSLAAGEVLFERGQAADALYVVLSGRLGVVLRAAPGAPEETVRTVMPGSALGEMGLLRRQPRTATVRALEDSVVLELGADQLAALEAADPPAAAALYRLSLLQMASRLDQLTRQVHGLAP